MSERTKFFSNKLQKEIEAVVLQRRKHTTVLELENGKVIIKKNSQLLENN